MTALILSDFPKEDELETGIPLFTANGSLPPGDFLPVRAEFENRFVRQGDVVARTSIYDGWNGHGSEDFWSSGNQLSIAKRKFYHCEVFPG